MPTTETSFEEESTHINLQRLPLGLTGLAVMHLVHMLAFLPAVTHDGSKSDRWFLAILAHAAMFPVATVAAPLARRSLAHPARWHAHFPLAMAALYLAFSALLTGFDQLAAPTPIAFVIGSIGLAIFFRWRMWPSFVFVVCAGLAVMFAELWQTDAALRRSVQVNCVSAAAIALLIARSSAGLHLPDVAADTALLVAERVRATSEHSGTTISVGVATALPGESAERWLARADLAMYGAKSGGRNRVLSA